MFELNDGAFLVDQYIPFCSPLAIHPRWPHWSVSQKSSLVFVQPLVLCYLHLLATSMLLIPTKVIVNHAVSHQITISHHPPGSYSHGCHVMGWRSQEVSLVDRAGPQEMRNLPVPCPLRSYKRLLHRVLNNQIQSLETHEVPSKLHLSSRILRSYL